MNKITKIKNNKTHYIPLVLLIIAGIMTVLGVWLAFADSSNYGY